MGLFGFFATTFGLGAMMKDGISRSLEDSRNYEKAKKRGDSTYIAGGHTISVKTGQRCITSISTDGHVYIKDLKGKIIEDETAKRNKRNQYIEKEKSRKKGWVFYRKTCWDANVNGECNVWVSDTIPGYFYFVHDVKESQCKVYRGTLQNAFCARYKCMKEVNFIGYKPKEVYYMDGTPVTKEENARRCNIERREEAIEKGKRFYSLYDDCFHYGDTQSDDIYESRYVGYGKDAYEYLVKVIKKYKEVPIPHHEGTKTVAYYEEVPDSERWNLDGTKYID